MELLRKMADSASEDSLATRLRRKRFALFEKLMAGLAGPARILDVGGTEEFWRMMGFRTDGGASVTLLNVEAAEAKLPGFSCVRGDARDMGRFADGEFDVVLSNSVIEHVGPFEEQRRMANEVRRVGKRYFVQTPNRYFPMEPHFLFPGFQFLPLGARAWLLMHMDLGWCGRVADRRRALEAAQSVRLLGAGEMRELFPEAALFRERFFGLTKSIVAYAGWPGQRDGRA